MFQEVGFTPQIARSKGVLYLRFRATNYRKSVLTGIKRPLLPGKTKRKKYKAFYNLISHFLVLPFGTPKSQDARGIKESNLFFFFFRQINREQHFLFHDAARND